MFRCCCNTRWSTSPCSVPSPHAACITSVWTRCLGPTTSLRAWFRIGFGQQGILSFCSGPGHSAPHRKILPSPSTPTICHSDSMRNPRAHHKHQLLTATPLTSLLLCLKLLEALNCNELGYGLGGRLWDTMHHPAFSQMSHSPGHDATSGPSDIENPRLKLYTRTWTTSQPQALNHPKPKPSHHTHHMNPRRNPNNTAWKSYRGQEHRTTANSIPWRVS